MIAEKCDSTDTLTLRETIKMVRQKSDVDDYERQAVRMKLPKNLSLGFNHTVSGSESIPIATSTIERSGTFVSLKTWSGTVLSIGRETFWAHVCGSDGVEEEVEFFISDVGIDDRSLLSEGAIFYFNIGYSKSKYGQLSRQSVLKFRRIPNWTSDEILDARKRAQERIARIHVE
jgi:hypothetical protein